jgi:putative NADH-flavin reductase
MKLAIVGASGKTGTRLVTAALERGHQVVAVCRDASVGKLAAFEGREGFSVVTAPVVSDEAALTRALEGCDAVLAVLISVRRLKATELVMSLAKAAAAHGVTRFVFTAGEVTAVPEAAETFTLRQRVMLALARVICWVAPYSVADMVQESELVRGQPGRAGTIVRAHTLHDEPPVGYRLCGLSEISGSHALSRDDYAACMLDVLEDAATYGRLLTVVRADPEPLA